MFIFALNLWKCVAPISGISNRYWIRCCRTEKIAEEKCFIFIARVSDGKPRSHSRISGSSRSSTNGAHPLHSNCLLFASRILHLFAFFLLLLLLSGRVCVCGWVSCVVCGVLFWYHFICCVCRKLQTVPNVELVCRLPRHLPSVWQNGMQTDTQKTNCETQNLAFAAKCLWDGTWKEEDAKANRWQAFGGMRC